MWTTTSRARRLPARFIKNKQKQNRKRRKPSCWFFWHSRGIARNPAILGRRDTVFVRRPATLARHPLFKIALFPTESTVNCRRGFFLILFLRKEGVSSFSCGWAQICFPVIVDSAKIIGCPFIHAQVVLGCVVFGVALETSVFASYARPARVTVCKLKMPLHMVRLLCAGRSWQNLQNLPWDAGEWQT